MSVEIVSAQTPEHMESVRALFLEYAASLGFSLCFQGFDEELATLPGRYGPPSGLLLLAIDEEGEPIGCVGLRRLDDVRCEMKRLYVKPSLRGQGVGRRLVVRLLEQALCAGYEWMRLDTGGEMVAAQALYRSLGFVEIERYNSDHIAGTVWMELRLR